MDCVRNLANINYMPGILQTFLMYTSAVVSGTMKAIFGYGDSGSSVSLTNLVSNTGVVSTDTTGVGTARQRLAAAGYSLT